MTWEEDNIQEQEEPSEESVKPKQSEEKKEEPATIYESGDKAPMPEIVKEIKATGAKVYELMDAEDEKQIVKAELFDETIKTLVYKPTSGEQTLTITGIMEAARRYKNIHMGIKKVEKTADSWIAYGYAQNIKDNLYIELAVEQPFRAPIGPQGSLVKDPFALQKAQAKAIRNCVRKVIPVNYFQAMLKLFVAHRPTVVAKKVVGKR